MRPVAAGDVGQNEEGFPDVGGAVVEVFGDFGLGVGDGIGVGGHECFALLAQVFCLEMAEALGLFLMGFALHADDDAAVGQGIGEVADGGDGFGAPGAESGE